MTERHWQTLSASHLWRLSSERLAEVVLSAEIFSFSVILFLCCDTLLLLKLRAETRLLLNVDHLLSRENYRPFFHFYIHEHRQLLHRLWSQSAYSPMHRNDCAVLKHLLSPQLKHTLLFIHCPVPGSPTANLHSWVLNIFLHHANPRSLIIWGGCSFNIPWLHLQWTG